MTDSLTTTFAALADPTRRAILARLASGETSVTNAPPSPPRPSMDPPPAGKASTELCARARSGPRVPAPSSVWRPRAYSSQRARPIITAASGRRASIDWTNTYRNFKPRRRSMAASSERTSIGANPLEREVVITRVFDAPRELVFKPERLMCWWGPHGWTNPKCEVDLRPCGAWRIVMRSRRGRVSVWWRLSRDRATRTAGLHQHRDGRRGQAAAGRADHGHARRR